MRRDKILNRAGWPAGGQNLIPAYGGSHTAKRSCEAADLSWHVRTERQSTCDIWRQPYSEKELRSSGFELAWADGKAEHMRHMAAAIQRKGAAKQRI